MTNIKLTYYYHGERRERFESLEKIAEMIVSQKYKRDVSELRGLVRYAVENNIKHRVGADIRLPAANFAVSDTGYTGFVVLTLPFGEDETERERIFKIVTSLQQTLMAFVGSSARSVKVVMPYAVLGGALPENDDAIRRFHSAAFASASSFIMQVVGIKAELKDESTAKMTVLSADDCLYYNPSATVVPLAMPKPDDKIVELSSDTLYNHNRLPDYSALQMEVTKFNLICRRLGVNADTPSDEIVLKLADECRRSGVTEEVAVKCALCFSDWRTHELMVRTAFETVYKDRTLGDKSVMTKSLFNQHLLFHFLQNRYLFRRNVVTGSLEYMERGKYINSWKPLNDQVVNTICLAAQMAGIEAWDNDLRRFVHSDLVKDYDPISGWLYSLPTWDGVDRVGALAGSLHSDNPDTERFFRIWMRSMVSQWMNRSSLYGSSAVLMLIGGQGTGKSTFCKRLLPPELTTYYNDRIDFVNKREAERALMRFALICMDEFDQITKSQTAYLKHIIQKSDIKWRKMYQDDIEQRHRYAAFCATTNSLTPLTDPSGSRRYLCVHVAENIDNSETIDYQQLYAQIVEEIKKGEQCYFTAEDERIIQKNNEMFYEQQPLEVLFVNYFRGAADDDDFVEMTALEILQFLKTKATGVKLSGGTTRNFGKLLAQLQIPRRRLTRGWVYKVVYL